MITVHTITYNEEVLIQFMIDHYRTRFPGCRIIIHNNMSTDNSVKIALANRCEIVPFDTGNQINDLRYLDVKNNCWKDASTDWVLICDTDELLDINSDELKMEENSGTSIIRSEGYDMVSMDENLDIAGMKFGARDEAHDKSYLFNKKLISEINYDIGCHICNPTGKIVYSQKVYKLYHYCMVNYALSVEKYKLYGTRMSAVNLANDWGSYDFTPEEIRAFYTEAWSKAVKVR